MNRMSFPENPMNNTDHAAPPRLASDAERPNATRARAPLSRNDSQDRPDRQRARHTRMVRPNRAIASRARPIATRPAMTAIAIMRRPIVNLSRAGGRRGWDKLMLPILSTGHEGVTTRRMASLRPLRTRVEEPEAAVVEDPNLKGLYKEPRRRRVGCSASTRAHARASPVLASTLQASVPWLSYTLSGPLEARCAGRSGGRRRG